MKKSKPYVSLILIFSLLIGFFSVMFTKEVLAADTGSGLLAHWKFDGDFTECVSGLITSNGKRPLDYVDGIFGKAANFNGKDNYLRVAHNEILNLGSSQNVQENKNQLTISYWIYCTDLNNRKQTILDKGQKFYWEKDNICYWDNPYQVNIEGNQMELALSNEFADTNLEIQTEGNDFMSGTVDGNEWKLITFTYDGATMSLYSDNELIKQKKYSDGFAFNEDELFIGINGCGMDGLFKGYLDDLRIYNRALSYSDVDALYQDGLKANKELVEPTKQLVAYYSFEGNLKDSSIFENHAEKVAVGGTTKYVIGKNGKAITISKGNYIRISSADQLNFDYDFTISFWLREELKDQNSTILCRLSPSLGDSMHENDTAYKIYSDNWSDYNCMRFGMDVSSFNCDSWIYGDGSSIEASAYKDENNVIANNWNHFTYTYTYDKETEKGKFQIYLNGKLFAKNDSFTDANVANADGDLYIGFDNNSFFTGSIDELKIYNTCLDATAVKEEYTRVDTIQAANAKSIVKNNTITIKVGKSVSIPEITLTDADNKKNTIVKSSSSDITFKTSKKSIVTVTKEGVLTGKKVGTATIVINYGTGISVSYKVKVVK